MRLEKFANFSFLYASLLMERLKSLDEAKK